MYPEPFAALVSREETALELPRGLVHGVMRQESAFDPGATSPVGARGLMQLMPTTAARAAREANLAFVDEDVTRASVNVRLGAHYLGKLLSRYARNTAVTAAAYNAGPHAVHSWLAHRGDEDLDLWVARIPFRETRDYVSAVVGNMLRYQYLAGGSSAVAAPSLTVPPAPVLDDTDY
jgi:soluble lytic murein transglycosylase